MFWERYQQKPPFQVWFKLKKYLLSFLRYLDVHKSCRYQDWKGHMCIKNIIVFVKFIAVWTKLVFVTVKKCRWKARKGNAIGQQMEIVETLVFDDIDIDWEDDRLSHLITQIHLTQSRPNTRGKKNYIILSIAELPLPVYCIVVFFHRAYLDCSNQGKVFENAH